MTVTGQVSCPPPGTTSWPLTEAAGGLTQLPREALPDPVDGTPLALHRLVTSYRKAPAAAPVRPLPGPLRIGAAIAAPSTGGGGVLDHERELRRVGRGEGCPSR